jgi:two-component system response regulator YesN
MNLIRKTRSMSVWLFLSFLSIILLLILFIFYSLGFFRGQIRDEIIKYNNLYLSNTVQTYENRFKLIQDSILNFSFNENIPQNNNTTFQYLQASQLQADIQNLLENKSLYLDNLFIYYQDHNLMLEKTRGKTAEQMFGEYFISAAYPPSFWTAASPASDKYQIYAAAEFSEIDVTGKMLGSKTLLPIAIHNKMLTGIELFAMLDVQALQRTHTSAEDNAFFILDSEQSPLYYSKAFAIDSIPQLSSEQGFQQFKEHYFFFQKGSYTGLTYLNIIPSESIRLQNQWKLSFVTLLALTILISITASLYVSRKLNEPLQRIIHSLYESSTAQPHHSFIDEYNVLHGKVQSIMQTNDLYHQDLSEKNSLLKYYSYMNKLKKIRDPFKSMQFFVEEKHPYRLILFQLFFKPQLYDEMNVDVHRAAFFIREFISNTISKHFQESLTFQIEKDQILCVIVGDIQESVLAEIIDSIITVLDLDRQYVFSAIVIGSPVHNSHELDQAYEDTLARAAERTFTDETHLVSEAANTQLSLSLTPTQENEWDVNFAQGNDSITVNLLVRKWAYAQRNRVSAANVIKFSNQMLEKIEKTLISRQIDISVIHKVREQLKDCYNYEQLELIFSELIQECSQLIRDHKGQKDSIAEFITHYLEQHYNEDVTMDLLADKLNMSRSYLSTYYKEKTGINYLDYLNQLRVGKAKQLLEQSSFKIQEIAEQVGYHNINSFNRMFKKYTGLTPSEFRQKN